MNHVETKTLPPTLRRALKSLGYHRKDIGIKTGTTWTPFCTGGGDGYRDFVAAVNLETGDYKRYNGSWGGANMFNPHNAVDLDQEPKPLPVGSVIVNGSEGGGRPVYATLTVHPENVAKLLPISEEVTEQERTALAVIGGIKGGYRQNEWCYKRLPGSYGADNPLIRGLADRGFLKINRAGSISITTKGKNVRGRL